MFSRNRETHHESGTTRSEYDPLSTASSLCFAYPTPWIRQDFQRNLQPAEAGRGINISGVDFWHAVEFSRNGRFLCTHPRGLSSGRFPSVLRFRLYQTLSCPIPGRSGYFLLPFGCLSACPLL